MDAARLVLDLSTICEKVRPGGAAPASNPHHQLSALKCARRLTAAYNHLVASAQRQKDSSHKQQRHAAYATETSGLLFIAILLLVIILIRYWHAIHWSWR